MGTNSCYDAKQQHQSLYGLSQATMQLQRFIPMMTNINDE